MSAAASKRQAAREVIDILTEVSFLLARICRCPLSPIRVSADPFFDLEYPSRPANTLAMCFFD